VLIKAIAVGEEISLSITPIIPILVPSFTFII
jgi:hypothetical protein